MLGKPGIARLANLNDSNLPQGDEALHGGGDVVHGVVGVVEAVTEEDGIVHVMQAKRRKTKLGHQPKAHPRKGYSGILWYLLCLS